MKNQGSEVFSFVYISFFQKFIIQYKQLFLYKNLGRCRVLVRIAQGLNFREEGQGESSSIVRYTLDGDVALESSLVKSKSKSKKKCRLAFPWWWKQGYNGFGRFFY